MIQQLWLVIKRQQAEIDELKAAVGELKNRLNQNSQNSSRAPSSAGFKKPKPAVSPPTGKRGGQVGKLKRTKGRNLLERLSKHQAAVLRFAHEADVPFTNNANQ